MEKRYMISDASKMVEVESHVLRYWEDELKLDVPRNEMGHRYYTDVHIQLFKDIKRLKERGFLLRAIKLVLPDILDGKDPDTIDFMIEDASVPYLTNSELAPFTPKENRMEQFQEILGNIVTKAIVNNNEILGATVSTCVSTNVIKEMDYLLRAKEEREEARYRKLDEAIRLCQKQSKEKGHRFLFSKKK